MTDDAIVDALARSGRGRVRAALSRLARRLGLYRLLKRPSATQSTAFTRSFVALAGKMAAADGIAMRVEADAFEKFLEISPKELAAVRRVFDLAKEDVTGYEVYADRIGTLLSAEPGMKRAVLECLVYIACADGVLHPAEDHFLKTVACRFGYRDAEFRAIRALFVHDPDSPYTILDVPFDAPLSEITRRYRLLVQASHPDRLIAQGAPPAVVKAANAKLAAINQAYEEILKERRPRASS